MYLHIGRNVLVPQDDIVAIMDLQAIRDNVSSREFLELAASEGRLKSSIGGEAKSCIMMSDDTVYLSPIASTTLARRMEGGWKGYLNGERE